MKCKRIISKLEIKGPNLVKGVNLEGMRVLGKPEQFSELYYKENIDELHYQDTVASLYGRNNLEEIVDVTDVEIVNKTGGLYSDTSLSIKSYISADGRILYAPNNVVYELRYPNRDIRGTIK